MIYSRNSLGPAESTRGPPTLHPAIHHANISHYNYNYGNTLHFDNNDLPDYNVMDCAPFRSPLTFALPSGKADCTVGRKIEKNRKYGIRQNESTEI